ncbi:ATP-binding protein [Candidatus Woesearchaeota archaeon]|nr:ATP-binding protein [Candidatus Woesearchaeota archaeon]
MILRETLRSIVKSQMSDLSQLDEGIKRDKLAEIELNKSFATVISGVRRCGKSTLLRQLMKRVQGFYYFNFEDPRAMGFEASDLQKLNDVFAEEYGNLNHYFFDEVQNAQKWELFARALLDRGKYVVITGSNASLLSRELGTRLTGRHITYELFPFSFGEFLELKNKKAAKSHFQEYFAKGGFPEYLKYGKAEILHELLNDILARDIAVRHNIRSTRTLREMALYLIANVGKEFSYNSLKRTFSLGSTNTAIDFVSYFEDSYLLFTVAKFDYSLKKQSINPKKIYSIDNGLSYANSSSFSEDKGKMLENMAFLNLRKNFKGIFYFKGKNECDFLIKEGTKIKQALQVCYELNEDNKSREINGLLEAMEKFNLKQGLIITLDQDDEFEMKGRKIAVKPAWKWLK